MAIGSDGFVYGWGANHHGQIGCGKGKDFKIAKALRLEKFRKFSIKKIYCLNDNSFALTYDGMVYSWGNNSYCCLGLELDINEIVFEPNLINISKVISIGITSRNTYFLNTEGNLFFCGRYEGKNGIESFQKTPKKLITKEKFNSLYYMDVFHAPESTTSAVSHRNVYRIDYISAEKYENKTIHQFYFEKFKVTFNTLIIDSIKYPQNIDPVMGESNDVNQAMRTKIFEKRFIELRELGSGGFGRVMKVKDINTQTIFAIKQIYLKGEKSIFPI